MQKKSDAPFYRRILSDAWRIAWQHKHLWVFGFFATIVGFGGSTEAVFSASDRVYAFFPAVSSGGSAMDGVPGLATLKAVVAFSSFPAISMLIFVAVMAFFLSVFIWMTYVSIGALVQGARKIEKGGEPTFGDGLKSGAETFWPVFGVNLLVQMFVFCGYVLTATTLLVMMADRTLLSGIFYIGTFIVFTLMTIAAEIVSIFATCFVVLKGKKLMPALAEGWNLLADNWLVSLELAIALLVATLVIGLCSVLAGLIASVPFVFMMMVAAVFKLGSGSVMVLILASTLLLALIIVVGSFITVFQASAWTLLFGELTEKRPLAKLRRLARRIHPSLG